MSGLDPYRSGLPSDVGDPRPHRRSRLNLFAAAVAMATTDGYKAALGWDYTNSYTRAEASPGTSAAPARKYWLRGTGTSTIVIKADITYSGADPVTIVFSYSDDNEATWTTIQDEFGNSVLNQGFDGAGNLAYQEWTTS